MNAILRLSATAGDGGSRLIRAGDLGSLRSVPHPRECSGAVSLAALALSASLSECG